MIYTIGIDPGASGAIVVLYGDLIRDYLLMPTMKIGSANRVNGAALAEFLTEYDSCHAYIELVGAMPGQGVTSMFNFGHSCGVAMGVLAALQIKHTLVTPQAWKRDAGLIGTEKDAARSRAIQLWPAWRQLDAKGKGQALADAALIARFGEKLQNANKSND
jgi:crossover junction endodeoxyribonuclease RuvC